MTKDDLLKEFGQPTEQERKVLEAFEDLGTDFGYQELAERLDVNKNTLMKKANWRSAIQAACMRLNMNFIRKKQEDGKFVRATIKEPEKPSEPPEQLHSFIVHLDPKTNRPITRVPPDELYALLKTLFVPKDWATLIPTLLDSALQRRAWMEVA